MIKSSITKKLILPILAILIFLSTPLYKDISEKYINDTLKDAVVIPNPRYLQPLRNMIKFQNENKI